MSKLEIHVGGTFADTKHRVLDAAARAERGEPVAAENHVTFESWAALSAVMTGKRFEVLRHLHRCPEASIAALARHLGRDYTRVHGDVEALATAGLIDRDATGLRVQYDEIRTTVAL